MRQKIDTVRTTTGSAAELESQLSTLREELDQQRRFRTEQLEELAAEAEAMATADQNRLQVTRVLTLAAEAACRRSTPRCSGSRRARTESASAVPSRSHGND
jgi:hypothetical protein